MLFRSLMSSLSSLRLNKNIIITEADKNMGIVVMDTQQYIDEGLRQLNDEYTYQSTSMTANRILALFKRQREILDKHNQLFEQVSNNSKQLSSHAKYILQLHGDFEKALQTSNTEEEKSLLVHKYAAKFYLLMKMHKTPVVGRPIVSTVHSATYFASKYLDKVLQPLLPLIPSYIQSSQHLIYQLEASSSPLYLPDDCVILCADIESLYPNIPTDIGLQLVEKAVIELGENFSEFRTPGFVKFVIELLKFVLKSNFFLFGSKWFHQIKGTAMGTPVAVPFACLFVYAVEKSALCQLAQEPILYKR